MISDRLYRKYIAKENIKDLCLLLDSIKIGFIGYLNSNSKFETYREYFRALNKISLDSLELLELGEDDVKIQHPFDATLLYRGKETSRVVS